MDEVTFWELIEESRAGRPSKERQASRLVSLLHAIPITEIRSFHRILLSALSAAYRWDLVEVADIVNPTLSEDLFLYFRGWLVSLGKSTYEHVLTNPDSLADQRLRRGTYYENESFIYAAISAYQKRTGKDMPRQSFECRRKLKGKPHAVKDYPKYYPRLCAKLHFDPTSRKAESPCLRV